MTLSPKYRRLLAGTAAVNIVLLTYTYWPQSTASVAPGFASVDQAEKRLARLREIAATVPAKEGIAKTTAAELATREKGLVQAETAAQAQAQMIQMVRRLASAENPPIEIRNLEIGAVAPFGDAYGSVTVAVQMECRIEQLVNLLTAVGSQPELISPSDLRVTSSSPKEKTLGARVTLMALVPRKLVPEKKTGVGF